MHVHLKVKIKTLTEEAKIIRKEELKAKTSRYQRRSAKRKMRLGNQLSKLVFVPLSNLERENATKMAEIPSDEAFAKFWGLRDHRKSVVGPEARASHIAYGYLRGRTYRQIEVEGSTKPNWDRVEQIVMKFGEYLPAAKADFLNEFKKWVEDSK